MPAWDAYAGALLDAALTSILTQDVPVRTVVIDNASSVPIAVRSGVEVVRSPRRLLLGEARNLGVELVDTPYLVVWDADDLMLPGTLALLERTMTLEPRLVAYGAAIVEAPDGVRHRWPRRWVAALLPRPRLLQAVQCIWSVFPSTGATIMRTAQVQDACGYPPTNSGDDWVLGVSLAFRGRLGWTERPGRLYRRDPQSVWARSSDARHLRSHARDVRRRIRLDSGIAQWARAALPLIAVLQHAAIVLSRIRARRGH
ncbi:MAG: glycosyltransferase [Solirubrobacteraceae bacterium]